MHRTETGPGGTTAFVRRAALPALAAISLMIGAATVLAAGLETPQEVSYPPMEIAPAWQDDAQVMAKSDGCMTCHTKTDEPSMHRTGGVMLGCVDCHGGDTKITRPSGTNPDDETYVAAMKEAHVKPTLPETWHYPSSANPEISYTLLNSEAREYVRFVNPSDYRVAEEACGACHMPQIRAAKNSLMATGAMLWGGAAYNNGILPYKSYVLGEAYTPDGEPAAIQSPVKVTEEMKKAGILEALYPLPAWEVIPPADVFRVFERGGRNIINLFPEIAVPSVLGQVQRLEEGGRPDLRQSNRGPGTGLRIAVPVINVTKTRLNDPFTWFIGTNDQPGDFRHSGCASCHVVYANDREPRHSGPYHVYGNQGFTQTADPTIPRNESGHPLKHEFTSAIPTSQCMICHMHQPNIFLNSYLGYTMWDYESDAPLMFPKEQKYPSHSEMYEILSHNPEEAAIRGLWGDRDFLQKVWTDINPKTKNTTFADYHSHGWNFRAIYKKDEAGNLLDAEGNIVDHDDPKKFEKAQHMYSIHAEVGMHCVDCHFEQDTHGNGHLYGEVADAIEITCKDCHGTADAYPTLKTSGPAAPGDGNDLSLMRNSDGSRRFEWRDGALYQKSALWPGREWKMSLVKDSVTPGHGEYNEKSARAKTVKADPNDMAWGPGVASDDRAHQDDEMECFTCHLSWTTSCAGCHLPIQANWKTQRHHYEGGETRNFATYNPQVARDQMFQLGKHSTVKGNTIAPVRSSSALLLSSTNINRERIYIQQPPIAANGFSSQAFAPHFPHTVRKTETKTCSDCHLSDENDNNARMAQLLLQGTNFVNFVGYNAWVGGDGGIEAVRVTEWDEPQAVIGSFLHRYVYPDWYQDHLDRDRELAETYTHGGPGAANCLMLRGEYLFVAEGEGGFQAYDVASIANKGFSQRIITAPFSPLGHSTRVKTENATCLALPTNQNINPDKNTKWMQETNQEQPFHPIYNYVVVTDAVEGLILSNVNTLADAEPRNNYFTRDLTWNPDGILDGARHLTIAGHYVYVTTDDSLVVLDLDDPMSPKVTKVIEMDDPRATAVQFRYLFITDSAGMWTFDITDMANPVPVPGAMVPLADGQKIYVARTYAYVAAGSEGLAIINVKRPTEPKLLEMFTADGKISDARDVIVGTTNASLYAYVADGVNGLKVVHLTSPDKQPRYYGFSPEPKPELIAWRETAWPALSLAKGLDRDRAVDETGGQIAVLGRLGSRPFTKAEMEELYLDNERTPYFVSDEPVAADFRPGPPKRGTTADTSDANRPEERAAAD